MGNKKIFLSHIHEERELAVLFKRAIEDEFSGFVEVFVSSDGVSIPAGANFLKRIEDGLVECIAAIYLISPLSVNRNWINFELGCVWIRNSLSVRANGPEVPALPICHSGIKPSQLPKPIDNLNAIEGNQSSRLEFAFKSIQSAVGGRGVLRTDFDELARKVIEFERGYTKLKAVAEILYLLDLYELKFKLYCEALSGSEVVVDLDFVSSDVLKKVRNLSMGMSSEISVKAAPGSSLAYHTETLETGQKCNLYVARSLALEVLASCNK